MKPTIDPKKLFIQSNQRNCGIAVIRSIRSNIENSQFSENDIFKGFTNEGLVRINGPNINDIKNYWKNLFPQYEHQTEDDQNIDDIEIMFNKGFFAMVICNSFANIFHCILYLGLKNNYVGYWDPFPTRGTLIKKREEFDNLRRHDNPMHFREIHYVRSHENFLGLLIKEGPLSVVTL